MTAWDHASHNDPNSGEMRLLLCECANRKQADRPKQMARLLLRAPIASPNGEELLRPLPTVIIPYFLFFDKFRGKGKLAYSTMSHLRHPRGQLPAGTKEKKDADRMVCVPKLYILR